MSKHRKALRAPPFKLTTALFGTIVQYLSESLKVKLLILRNRGRRSPQPLAVCRVLILPPVCVRLVS